MTSRIGDLRMQTLAMFSDSEAAPSQGTPEAVRDLLEKVRDALAPAGQQLGMWETFELNNADLALDAGFTRLALIGAGKALALHQLPEAEYAFGLDAARHGTTPPGRTGAPCPEAASALLTGQAEAAGTLAQTEEDAARKLKSAGKETAATLASAQHRAASTLLEKNSAAADSLAKAQSTGMDALKENEASRTTQLREQEQALSWMAGGYSVGYHLPVLSSEDSYTAMNDTQKTAAIELKETQDKTARGLKKFQAETAADLKAAGKCDATALKTEQQETAAALRETQTLRAIQKDQPAPDAPDQP